MKLFDPTKPVQTRDGRPVVIYAGNLRGGYPILAAVYDPEIDGDETHRYASNGAYSKHQSNSPNDLVNIPTKHVREFWINFYPNRNCSGAYSTSTAALTGAGSDVIACKKVVVEFEEGEGL